MEMLEIMIIKIAQMDRITITMKISKIITILEVILKWHS